jgi:hypothetical protein
MTSSELTERLTAHSIKGSVTIKLVYKGTVYNGLLSDSRGIARTESVLESLSTRIGHRVLRLLTGRAGGPQTHRQDPYN